VKILERRDVLDVGGASANLNVIEALRGVEDAIRRVDWPHGSGLFTIRPVRRGNGVLPIKLPCMASLRDAGWQTEALPDLQERVLTSGDLDALYQFVDVDGRTRHVALEWETGNISSSHRAINKLVTALKYGAIYAGVLVLPSNALAKYLTDRIGNIGELEPYLPMWADYPIEEGLLRIYVMEYDAMDSAAPLIPKRLDGMSFKRRGRQSSR
jgi:hypothetical protein